MRFASEDVGLADPQALPQALAGWQSYERLGSPEGEVALAQVAIYLALAPKSVAVYRAYGEVKRTIEERPADPVPLALRNAPTKLMKGLGYGRDYAYAPDTRDGRRRSRVPAGQPGRHDLLPAQGPGLRGQARRAPAGVRAPPGGRPPALEPGAERPLG